MKIPQYEKQVQIQTPKQGLTQINEAKVPDVLPAAYGADVAQATAQVGKTIQSEAEQLQVHYDALQKDNEHKDNLRRETSFRQELNDIMYNPEQETIKTTDPMTGQEIETTRTKGIMLRQLGQAQGATVQARKAYEALREKYLTGINERQASTLGPAIDNHYLTADEQVIKHEVTQLNADMKDAVESNLKQMILDSATIRDPEALKLTLTDYEAKVASYNKQFNPATQKFNLDEGKLKIVNANIEDMLLTFDKTQAQAYLDQVKDSISPEVYNAASKNLTTKAMAVEAQKRYLNLMYGEQNHDTIMDKIKNNTLTFKDIEDQWAIPEDKGGIKHEVLLQYQRALKERVKSDLTFIIGQKDTNAKGKKKPTQGATKAAEFIQGINGLIADDVDRWKAREIIAKMYADGIADEKELPFLNSLTKKFDDIKFNRASGFWINQVKKVKKVFKQQNASDEELTLAIKGLINSTIDGVDPVEGANNAIKQYNVSANPHVATANEKGTEMIDPFGNIALVYPDGWVDDEYQSVRKARKSADENKEKKQ